MKMFTTKLMALLTVIMVMMTICVVPASAASFEITTNAVEQPAYNSQASYALVAEADGVAITEGITWELDGTYADATLTEAGQLTITRTGAAANSETIKVKATYNSETVSADITVTPVEAYLRSDRSAGSYTAGYTREQFVADMAEAQNIAVLNFEEGNYVNASTKYLTSDYTAIYGGSKMQGGKVDISNCTETKLNVYLSSLTSDTVGYSAAVKTDIGNSGTRSLSIWTGEGVWKYLVFGYDTSTGGVSLVKPNTTDLRATKVGFVLSSGNYSQSSETFSVKVKYSDGTTSTEETVVSKASAGQGLKENAYFVGIEAAHGKYIQHIGVSTKAGGYLDDVCVIMEDPNALAEEDKVDSFEITGETTIEQPAYNSVAKYTYTAVAKDSEKNILNPEISWKLDGDYGDNASIDSNGVLTVKRGIDTTKPINIKAYVYSEVLGKNIESEDYVVTVTATEPYLRADKIKADATSYTRTEFLADMAKAEKVAVLNFEDGEEATGKNYTLYDNPANASDKKSLPCYRYSQKGGVQLPVTNSAAKLRINWERKNTQTNEYGNQSIGIGTGTYVSVNGTVDTNSYKTYAATYIKSATDAVSGEYSVSILTNVGNTIMYFDNAIDTYYRPVKVGYVCRSADDNERTHTATVMYSDGTTEVIEGRMPALSEGKSNFFGIEAPAGKFIISIQLDGGGVFFMDDICVVLDSMPKLTTKNASGAYPELNFIDELNTEVKFTSPVTNGTVILAFYGAGGKLVAVKSASGGEVTLPIDTEETYTKIAGFVWNSITGLTPIGNCAIVEN